MLIACTIPSQRWSMVFFSSRYLIQSAQNLRLSIKGSPSNRTMTQSPQLRQRLYGLWTPLWMSLSGPARAWTWTQSNISGETGKRPSTDSPYPTWPSLRGSAERLPDNLQMQMCKACCIIPKKNRSCKHSRSAELRVWILMQHNYFSFSCFNKFAMLSQIVFCLFVCFVIIMYEVYDVAKK